MDREKKSIPAMMERVLIVEDNRFFLQFLKETLHTRFPSMNILEAANKEGALQKIESFKPEAIFVDIRLPGENGLELTKQIKAEHPDIIVIIITNYDLPEYRKAAYQCKADHFLSKDSFLNMAHSILSNRNRNQDDSLLKEPR